MGKGSTRVEAPNPIEVAQADARFNRIDQFTPFGNLTFGGPDRNQARLTLNPAVQDLENRRLLSDRLLLDTALSRQGDIKGGSLPSLIPSLQLSNTPTPFPTDSPANVPNVPDSIGAFQSAVNPATNDPNRLPLGAGSGAGAIPGQGGFQGTDGSFGKPQGAVNDQVGNVQASLQEGLEQALFNRQASLLQPGFDQEEERIRQRLADQGLDPFGEAAQTELANFRRGRDETLSRLGEGAVQGGLQAQLQNANLIQANRATQFNELAALLGLNQVAQPGLNNFFTPGQADVTGGFALNQQAQNANANRAAGQKGGLLGGATQLGSAFLGNPSAFGGG